MDNSRGRGGGRTNITWQEEPSGREDGELVPGGRRRGGRSRSEEREGEMPIVDASFGFLYLYKCVYLHM